MMDAFWNSMIGHAAFENDSIFDEGVQNRVAIARHTHQDRPGKGNEDQCPHIFPACRFEFQEIVLQCHA
jgi:hypothetical protein